MANDLVLSGGRFERPAHLTVPDGKSNLVVMSNRVPLLSVQGRAFTIMADGKEMRLTKNVDGEELDIKTLPIVILGFNVKRGRSYYQGKFDPKNLGQPTCWSRDGSAPDETVKDKQAATCAVCPMAAKNSTTTDDGQGAVACREFRLLAVVPYLALKSKMPPLRLKVAVTSDYDGRDTEYKAREEFAFSQYVDFIRTRGVAQSWEMVTKLIMTQEQGVSYSKLKFGAVGWIKPDDQERIQELIASPEYSAILNSDENEVEGDAQDRQATTRSARGGGTHHGTAAETKAPAQQQKPVEQPAPKPAAPDPAKAAAAAALRAKAEAARLAAEAAAAEAEAAAAADAQAPVDTGTIDAGNVTMDLSGETKPPQTAMMVGGDQAPVDPKKPPQATPVADDGDVDDIMKQWGGE